MSAQLPLAIPPAPSQEKTAALKAFHPRRQPMPLGEVLAGESAARRQQGMILHVLERAGVGVRMTPSEVHAVLVADLGRRAPLLTSVRARMTTMATEDAERWPAGCPLRHHPKDRRPGPFGKTEGTWSLAERRS